MAKSSRSASAPGARSSRPVTAARQPVQHRLLEEVDQRHSAPVGTDLGREVAQVARLRSRVQVGQLDRTAPAPVGDLQPGQVRQRRVQRGQLGAHLVAQLVDERGRFQRLTQGGVVRGPVSLEVVRQILVGVAPPIGADDPDLLATQAFPQCWNAQISYTARSTRRPPPLPPSRNISGIQSPRSPLCVGTVSPAGK